MNGYGSHTFKNVNSDGNAVYVKYHFKTDQGIKNLTVKEGAELAGQDPDYATRDLYNAIAEGDFPSWTAYIQVMTFEQAEEHEFNPFDVTKTWSHKDFPLIEIGKMVLDRNPSNYFAEVEQIAFNPANMVPGIEPSPDKMLQGRLFSYSDTQRHRLGGANYTLLPVNRPYKASQPISNNERDGLMRFDDNQADTPNYEPNSFSKRVNLPGAAWHADRVPAGDVKRYNSLDDDNFTQCKTFYWKVLSEEEREMLAENIAGHLGNAQEFIQARQMEIFNAVDPDYASRVREKMKSIKNIEPPRKMKDVAKEHIPPQAQPAPISA
jgi:catalase